MPIPCWNSAPARVTVKRRYAGRGMDGTQFARESLGLRFEKLNLGQVSKLERRSTTTTTPITSSWTTSACAARSNQHDADADGLSRWIARTLGGRLALSFDWDAVELVSGIDASAASTVPAGPVTA